MIPEPWTRAERTEIAAILRERHAEPDTSELDRVCYRTALYHLGEAVEEGNAARARGQPGADVA